MSTGLLLPEIGLAARTLPEFLQPLFSGVSSLGSLHQLLKTSPAASSQFATHGSTIFEAVLSSRKIHAHTCALIRISALVRSGNVPPHIPNLTAFTDWARHETTSHRYWPPAWTYPPVELTAAVSASTLLAILATHQEIECLVAGCLLFYLKRFRALRPFHLVDPTFQFQEQGRASNGDLASYVGPWELKPAEKPFPVHDIGPPTWIEEQRVLRAFWRIQLLRDWKEASRKGLFRGSETDPERLRQTVPADPMEPVNPVTEVSFHNPHRAWAPSTCPLDAISSPERERLHQERMHILGLDSDESAPTIWGQMLEDDEMTADFDRDTDAVPELLFSEDCEPAPHQQDTLLEDQVVWSALEYTQEDARAIAAPAFLQSTGDFPAPVPAEQDGDWDDLSWHNSETHAFFASVAGSNSMHDRMSTSPLQHVPFRPFRRLGFAIWSLPRMASSGLLPPIWDPKENRARKESYPLSSVLNAWRSVLGEEELAEVARRNREWMNPNRVPTWPPRGPEA